MKQFKIKDLEVNNLSGVGGKLVAGTFLHLYGIYHFEPYPEKEKQAINKTIGGYHRFVSELEEKLRISVEKEEEEKIADSLKDYTVYLSQARVEGEDYLKQRDDIAEEMVRRVLGITEEIKDDVLLKYKSKLHELLEIVKRVDLNNRKDYLKKREEIFRGVK